MLKSRVFLLLETFYFLGDFMIKAVLFDLDGTLVNSLDDLANSVNFVLEEFGFPTHNSEEFKFFVGDGIPKMIERALPPESRDNNTQKKAIEKFFERYSRHCSDLSTAYSGVKELVCALKEKGIKVAVITNKAQELAEKVIFDVYGNMFDIIFGKRDGIPSKPDPTSTLMVMEKLGVNPCECIFFGDSGVDVKTGVSAGAFSVGVLWGYRSAKELKDNGAKFIITKPEELFEIIEELNGNKI